MWHWTGGEEVSTVFTTLETFRYGVEFYICDGTIYQLADPVLTDAFGAGAYNTRHQHRSIQNYGFRREGFSYSAKPRGKRPMPDAVQGGAAGSSQRSTKMISQRARHSLSAAIPTIPATTPVVGRMAPYPNFITPKQMERVGSRVGHYQLSKMKSDPGPQLLQRLLDDKGRHGRVSTP